MNRKRPRDPFRKTGGTETWVAFLRAVNVGGHSKIRMEDLRRVFLSAGCKNVRTVIQSGNVLYDGSAADRQTIHAGIRSELGNRLGERAMVVFRDLGDMAVLSRRDPFKEFKYQQDAKFYVAFLSRKPHLFPPFPRIVSEEGLEMVGKRDLEVFVVSRRKKNRMFGFPNALVEKEFGVAATTRNWSTIQKIAAFAMKRG